MDDVTVGDNVAYLLGKVEAIHKTVSVGSDEIMVKSLADDGESTVIASTYVGKEVLSIPGVEAAADRGKAEGERPESTGTESQSL